ncbi:hypothetical protein AZE42_08483 [Rhizopogon vesiculosus]|uniref:Uncharacterized protein n=1 Tax=Rhizopogon vesiculosus TaxID=180088 RepID=A0A1J8QNI7_9AGAM|nr:hypothetical protein AZE42_08483 [Rhizopogon vesiculosus]
MVPQMPVHLKGNLSKQSRFFNLLPFKLTSRRTQSFALFANLPTELCLLILTYAARPKFAPNRRERRKPYSSALALCRVSRTFRRIVLPLLLHTILLSEAKNVIAFIHALTMQEAYAQQENHLHVDYAAHIHRIWIGEIQRSDFDNVQFDEGLRSFLYVLAPVLLASKSIAFNFQSLFILRICIENALISYFDSNANKSFPPPSPWSIKTLTLSGDVAHYGLMDAVLLYAFHASITHIIFLSPPRLQFNSNFLPLNVARMPDELLCYDIFHRMSECTFPWDFLKSLQSISVVIPHITLRMTSLCPSLYPEFGWKNVPVEMRTFTAPMDYLSGRWAQEIPHAHSLRDEGLISSADVRTTFLSTLRTDNYRHAFLHWEQAWACGIRT